jgi:formylglycine-generating enzyme required for sulfatase activity
MKFVYVPAGTFPMGSNHGDIFANRMVIDSAIRGKADDAYFGNEQPQHQVYVSPYFIGAHEVTNAEYRVFLDEWKAGKVAPECEWPLLLGKPNHTPYLANDPRRIAYDGDRQPVVGISWFAAYAFCRWMGGRLPTEAEWEKAARGTDGRIFPWGNRYDPMRANLCESQNFRLLDVGTYPGGRSPYGCFDMAGNAAEYCLDAFEESLPRNQPLSNPCLVERHPGRDRRSQRGGSYNRFGFLFKGRTTARGFSKINPRFPDPSKESMDPFPITEYLFSGMRVVLSPLDELFSATDVERLRAEQKAVELKRIEAMRKKNAEAGRAGTPSLPTLPGTVPAAGDGELGSGDDDGPDGG